MRIAILCSGGDAPGMNACIETITKKGIKEGYEIYGIISGFKGLYEEKIEKLDKKRVDGISRHGGTILGSSRFPELEKREVQEKIVSFLKKRVDYLIVIGGNGSFNACNFLNSNGVKTIGIPATIDNDIPLTYSLGFDTALNSAIDSIEKIEDSAKSHNTSFIIEVMGNKSGNIAYNLFLSGLGDTVVIQEHRVDISKFLTKDSNIVIFSEGSRDLDKFKKKVEKIAEHEFKVVTLGHTQRGGRPSAKDRMIASLFGIKSIESIKENRVGYIAFWQDRVKIYDKVSKKRNKISKKEYLSILERGI